MLSHRQALEIARGRALRLDAPGDFARWAAIYDAPDPFARRALARRAADPRLPRVALVAADPAAAKRQSLSPAAVVAEAEDAAAADLVVVCDAGVTLAPHALLEFAEAARRAPDAGLFLADEDRVTQGRRGNPCFWTAADARLAIGRNRPPAVFALRRERLQAGEGGPWARFLLALAEGPAHATHAFLAHRAQPAVFDAQRNRREAADLTGLDLAPHAQDSSLTAISREKPGALASIVVPNRDAPALMRAVAEGVLDRTDHAALELIVVDNGSVDPQTLGLYPRLAARPNVRILRDPAPFNFSRLVNLGAREARGEVIVLLNNDVEITRPDWLTHLVAEALAPDAGAVGARLLYPDGRVQHAGMALDARRGAQHLWRFFSQDDSGPGDVLRLTHETGAVTAACLAVRRDAFLRAGGFDEGLATTYNDVAFCRRVAALGLRNLVVPASEMVHLESVTRGLDASASDNARLDADFAHMVATTGPVPAHDPFVSPIVDQTWRTLLRPRASSRLVETAQNRVLRQLRRLKAYTPIG